MKSILGLGTLGLLLLAGPSPAQEPIAGPSPTPVVQQGEFVPASTARSRRFGRWRGTRYYDNGPRYYSRRPYRGNETVVRTEPVMAGQPVIQASATTPRTEGQPVVKPETNVPTTPTVMTEAPPPVEQYNETPRRRGGLLSRLAARRGR